MAFFGKFRFQSSPKEVELYWKSFERYLLIVSYQRQKDENFKKHSNAIAVNFQPKYPSPLNLYFKKKKGVNYFFGANYYVFSFYKYVYVMYNMYIKNIWNQKERQCTLPETYYFLELKNISIAEAYEN